MVPALLEKYREELTGRVLPFWLRHALDRVHGGYFNCVDATGAVYDTRKHIWMQGRGAWMFARLYNSFEPRPEYKEAAEIIFRFLAHARHDEPRCWFSLTEDGKPAAFQRKPYTAFFVALALVEYSKISKDAAHVAEAVELFWLIEGWIRRPELLGRPPLPGGVGYTQLADLYVLGWLAFELNKVHADPRYEKVIQSCIRRLSAHFHPELKLLMENAATGDPEQFRQFPEGRLICVGSSLEVCWLFLQIAEEMQMGSAHFLREAVLGALEYGWDREHGGFYYFQDLHGRPPVALESNMKLWWPHTEAIIACAQAYKWTNDERFLEWWQRVDEYAFRTFADPMHGEWFGYCDRRGEVATPLKGGPYKGIFHVPRALLFTIQAYSPQDNRAMRKGHAGERFRG
ncbi:MAG: AGE family epimerase/isomerase [Acidobacteria bacterium]|nr:AGE family epimerase/isomerase [Acidobacteriota bacterium]